MTIYKTETEDINEHRAIINGTSYYAILWELKLNFPRKWKHKEMSEDYAKGVYDVLDSLAEELKDFNENEI